MTIADVSPCLQNYWRERHAVVGAFWDIDFLLFDCILSQQRNEGVRGDLLEIGAFYGKSAIVLGCHAASDEKVIVCDIFDDTLEDSDNLEENLQSYSGLNRDQFEQNYRRWVNRPPVIIAELSERVVDRVEPRSLRFAHIDGSHLYSVVHMDIANTRGLLNDSGVVVMDDFRALHTPGVAAAVWEAVANKGLIPICVSEQKFYGAWNPQIAQATRETVRRWAASQGEAINYGMQEVAGSSILIIQNPAPWGGTFKTALRIPSPRKKLTIFIETPAPWRKKHPAAAKLRDVLGRTWTRPYLGTSQDGPQ